MPTKADEDFVKEGAEKITDKDVEKVVDKSEEINEKFASRGPLKRFVEDAKILMGPKPRPANGGTSLRKTSRC